MQTTAISSSDAISRSVPSVPLRKYLWISFINSLKTALPNFLALIKATFHNIFSLKNGRGEWFKFEHGSIFELKSLSATSANRFVSLVSFNKKTSSTLVETLAEDVKNLVKAHFENKSVTNPGEIVLLGHSMGGLVAISAAKKLKEDYPNIRVVTVFSPHKGSNLLNIKQFNRKSTIDNNFHPHSPSFQGAAYATIACTRFIAAKDHIIPQTKEEILAHKQVGHHVTEDGHNTYSSNAKTIERIKQAVLGGVDLSNQHIFCIHGLNGTPGGLYSLAKAISS